MGDRKWFIYACSAVDWWDGWARFDPATGPIVGGASEYLAGLLTRRLAAAFTLAGWDGDSRDGYWYISGLPEPVESCRGYIIAVKQDNNGDTFIASTRPLHWLQDSYRDTVLAPAL